MSSGGLNLLQWFLIFLGPRCKTCLVALMAPKMLRWLLGFWKDVWPSVSEYVTATYVYLEVSLFPTSQRTQCVSFYKDQSFNTTWWRSEGRSTFCFLKITLKMCGPGSSVGIATELRAGRSGIESRWGRDFLPVQNGPGAHPASCKMVTGSFPRVKCGQDVLLTTHPLLVPRSWKNTAITLPTLWATPGL